MESSGKVGSQSQPMVTDKDKGKDKGKDKDKVNEKKKPTKEEKNIATRRVTLGYFLLKKVIGIRFQFQKKNIKMLFTENQ